MARLRVIAGSAKGRKLRMVPDAGTRPVMDRVKAALFNILGADVVSSHFLDLFAGTGSVGIEALSRGAERAVFVDASPRAVSTIRLNLDHTCLGDRAEIVRADSFSFLHRKPLEAFDYVYVAPPQYQGLWQRAVQTLDGAPDWLNPDAWVIAQMDPVEYQPLPLTHVTEFDQRRYGKTLLCFYDFPGE
jgi:16S rRNA (guanine966-N2)-methyltransferase